MASKSDLPYWLQYTPNDQLETPIDTKIIGEIPKWLTGTLYRNGSGMHKVGETTVKHLFDGMSVLHKFVIKDGKVTYQNKLLDSDSLNKSLKANRLMATQFATVAAPDPCKNIFSRFFSYFYPEETTDNMAVNIVPHGDMLVAFTEVPFASSVDPETLKKKEKCDLGDMIAVHSATAHPHSDADGCMYNLGTCFNSKQAYNIIKIPPQQEKGDNPFKRASLVATIPSRWKVNVGYNHSFGMSENYFVILEQTLVINLLKLTLMTFKTRGFESCMTDYPKEKAIIHLARRSDGKEPATRYVADSFFCFHFINCYEEDGHLIVDLAAHDSGQCVRDLYLEALREFGKFEPQFRRYVLPLNVEGEVGKNLITLSYTSATAVKQADGTILCTPDFITRGRKEAVIMELPRINYAYNTKKYRYAYGCGILTNQNVLTKVDLETKTTLTWQADNNDQVGEPVFVSKPGSKEEDAGVILSPVFPMDPENPSMLVVLDAKTFKELGRAVAPVGIKMPITFHGGFIP